MTPDTSDKKHASQAEPVGIVISNGPSESEAPRFSAYVWGDAPQKTRRAAPSKAA